MRNVKLSKRASSKLDNLLSYLGKEWSEKVKNDFIAKVDRALMKVQRFPESCPKSDARKGLYKMVVTKQTTVYYRLGKDSIYIVTIFDNRMHPKKLRKDLD